MKNMSSVIEIFRSRKLQNIIIVALITLPGICLAQSNLERLTVEYADSPIGIDTPTPRLSWQMTSDKFNVVQEYYQVKLYDLRKDLVWDSGKVQSSSSLGIQLPPNYLIDSQPYEWKVTVWNNKDEVLHASSNFETSFLNSPLEAWSNAKWIGVANNALPLFANYLPIYKLETSFQLDKKTSSNKFSLVFGANDPRLLDKNKNIYQLENKRDQSYIKIEVDANEVLKTKTSQAKLNVYRVGYSPIDSASTPLFSFDLPVEIINQDNLYSSHSIQLTSSFGTMDIHIDGNKYEIPKEPSPTPFVSPGININPLGLGSDFIAFPMLSEIGFELDKGQKASVSSLKISNYRAPSNTLFEFNAKSKNLDFFRTSESKNIYIDKAKLILDASEESLFVVANPSVNSMPMLRTEFNAVKPIRTARLYATARGVYDTLINGENVSDEYLNPGLTQYDKTQAYQTYDITPFVQQGKNAIGIRLGEGWWSGNQTFVGKAWNYFGDRQSLLAKILITYTDGSTKVVVSDPDNWHTFSQGPLIYSSLYQGEVYDATKEQTIKGWSMPGFDDSNWERAQTISTEGTTYPDSGNFYFGSSKFMEWPKFEDFTKIKFISQFNDSVKVVQTLKAKSYKEVRPGVYVYDLGQNIAGVPHINIKAGKAGQKIILRYAEITYPDFPEYQGNEGMIMLENIRGAHAQDEYIMKKGENTISPRFTYHGFRYIEITGLDNPLPLSQVTGLALSSVQHLDSNVTTSNKGVNKLLENITWSLRSNFLSIPTDCPQRNERMGWNGDISVFTPTANFLSNQPNFLRRHLLSMRDTQSPQGRFSDISPIGGGFGGILWGSAGITVAWEAFQQFNDIEMLHEHFSSMVKYMTYLAKTTPKNAGFLGDWLSPEGYTMGKNPANYLIWDAYYAYDLKLMAKMSRSINRLELAKHYDTLYKKQRDYFNQTYIDPTTKQTIDPSTQKPINTQASYAIPLGLNIINKKNKRKFISNFITHIESKVNDDQNIKRPEYSLMTGFIGTAWISKALSDIGRSDIAYDMLLQQSYPSWLYSVNQGATTIWERLNSFTHKNGFGGNNSMNSFNHYSFGSVGAWLYQYMLGIQRDEKVPAFQHFTLSPKIDDSGRVTEASGYYNSLYGKIESSWKIANKKVIYQVSIPPNTTASIYIPSKDINQISVNGKPLVEEYRYSIEHNTIKIALGSGKYSFVSHLNTIFP